MRKIEELANRNFNGNIEEALENLIKNKDPRFGEIVKELNKKEATFAFRKLNDYYVEKIIDGNFGGKEQFANDVMLEMKLDELGMTKEGVIHSAKNPFAPGVRNAVIKLCLTIIAPLILYMLLKSSWDMEWVFWVQGLLITYFSSETAVCLIKYVKFKNIKKKIKNLSKR